MSIDVSVIIPVYNAEKYLDECLAGILNQSLRNIEVICVDDGSTDGSARILKEYARTDGRMRIITQPNAGAGSARNTGMDAAEGEYLLFLDADDWFEPDYFESALRKIREDRADVCICGTVMFDNSTGEELPSKWMLRAELVPEGAFSPADVSEHLFQFTFGQVWDKLYRRAFLTESGIRYPALRAAEDTPFVYESLLAARRITVLPEVKVHYRVNRASSVSKSFARNVSAPFDAFSLIYDYVVRNGLMEKYEHSFINWAMEYLVWQVNNAPQPQQQKLYLEELKNRWFPRLGFINYPRRFFENRSSYLKYILAAYLPEKMYLLLLRGYKRRKTDGQ